MPQAKGSQSKAAIFDADTYGADPAVPDGQLLYFSSLGLQKTQNRIPDDTLSDSRGQQEPMLGNIGLSGPLVQNLSAQSIGKLLKHLMGGVATSGAGPYTHVFTIADLPANGFSIEEDYGVNITGSGRYIRHRGCKMASASFNFPSEGPCRVTFNIIGADGVPSDTPLDATLTDNGHTSFSAFSATIEEGAAALGIGTDLSFTIDNKLDEDGYVIGGAGKRAALEDSAVEISGTLTTLFTNADLMNKALNDTESSLKITLSRGDGLGSAGNESIEFAMNQLKYEPTTPPIDGPAGIKLTLKFFAYLKATDLGLIITLKNAVATV